MSTVHAVPIGQGLDFNDAETAEIVISRDGKTLWLNVDGSCLVRGYRIGKVVIDDQRVPAAGMLGVLRELLDAGSDEGLSAPSDEVYATACERLNQATMAAEQAINKAEGATP